jgi:hypothetical protein
MLWILFVRYRQNLFFHTLYWTAFHVCLSSGNEMENNPVLSTQTGQNASSDFCVASTSNHELQTKDVPQAPDSCCSSCGYQLPQTPYSSSSPESFSSCQPASLPEVAGESEVFGDLRSPSLARQRDKSAKQKYYGFRYVKRGDLTSGNVAEGQCCCSQDSGAEEAEHDQKDEQDDDVDSDNDNNKTDSQSVCTLCTPYRPPQPTTTTQIQQDQVPCKHTLYRLAQLPPRPPKNHHRHFDKVQGTLSPRVDERREQRKHRKAILKNGLEGL